MPPGRFPVGGRPDLCYAGCCGEPRLASVRVPVTPPADRPVAARCPVDTNPFRSARGYLNSTPAAQVGGDPQLRRRRPSASSCCSRSCTCSSTCSSGRARCRRTPACRRPGRTAFQRRVGRRLGRRTRGVAGRARRKVRPSGTDARPGVAGVGVAVAGRSTYAVLDRKVGRGRGGRVPPAAEPRTAAGPRDAEPRARASLSHGRPRAEPVDRRGRSAGSPAWNPWTWRPGGDGSANVAVPDRAVPHRLRPAAGPRAAAERRRRTWPRSRPSRPRPGCGGRSTPTATGSASLAVRPDGPDEAGDLFTRQVEQIQDGLAAWLTGSVRGPVADRSCCSSSCWRSTSG